MAWYWLEKLFQCECLGKVMLDGIYLWMDDENLWNCGELLMGLAKWIEEGSGRGRGMLCARSLGV